MNDIRQLAQYSPGGIEEKWYQAWEEAGLFAPDESLEADPFVITLPPPNVTGILHMGHCLGNSIQDTLKFQIRPSEYQGSYGDIVNTVHVVMFILFVFFIFLHAYMGMLGPKPSTHYKEMFTGWEEPHD